MILDPYRLLQRMPGCDERDTVESLVERLEALAKETEDLKNDLEEERACSMVDASSGNEAIEDIKDLKRWASNYKALVKDAPKDAEKCLKKLLKLLS